jgi:hypothetical protein
MPHVGGRHRDELGEAAVAVYADDLRVGADVSIAGAAEKAAPVDDVTLGGDSVALLHVGDEAPDFDAAIAAIKSGDAGKVIFEIA